MTKIISLKRSFQEDTFFNSNFFLSFLNFVFKIINYILNHFLLNLNTNYRLVNLKGICGILPLLLNIFVILNFVYYIYNKIFLCCILKNFSLHFAAHFLN